MVAITSSTTIAVKSERSHHWLNKSVTRLGASHAAKLCRYLT
jgi:hypothetical protein